MNLKKIARGLFATLFSLALVFGLVSNPANAVETTEFLYCPEFSEPSVPVEANDWVNIEYRNTSSSEAAYSIGAYLTKASGTTEAGSIHCGSVDQELAPSATDFKKCRAEEGYPFVTFIYDNSYSDACLDITVSMLESA